jgi:thiamine-monophosphate kinase
MLKGVKAPAQARAALVEAHRRPRPRIAEGRVLSREGVRCAMDVSDGLLDDLGKLCQASGVAARLYLDRLPCHPALAEAFPTRYRELALGGGEDYELLFTAAPELMARVLPLLAAGGTVVGEIVAGKPGAVIVLDAGGGEVKDLRGGWDHFR